MQYVHWRLHNCRHDMSIMDWPHCWLGIAWCERMFCNFTLLHIKRRQTWLLLTALLCSCDLPDKHSR
jgi:hypothetical protein